MIYLVYAIIDVGLAFRRGSNVADASPVSNIFCDEPFVPATLAASSGGPGDVIINRRGRIVHGLFCAFGRDFVQLRRASVPASGERATVN